MAHTSAFGSYVTVVKTDRVAILPNEFSEIILSANEQSLVDEAIVEGMFAWWEHKLQFGGIHFRPG